MLLALVVHADLPQQLVHGAQLGQHRGVGVVAGEQDARPLDQRQQLVVLRPQHRRRVVIDRGRAGPVEQDLPGHVGMHVAHGHHLGHRHALVHELLLHRGDLCGVGEAHQLAHLGPRLLGRRPGMQPTDDRRHRRDPLLPVVDQLSHRATSVSSSTPHEQSYTL